VFGAGPVGSGRGQSAWLMGAGPRDRHRHLEYRLEKARTFAHAETFNFTEYDDIVVEMKKQTDFLGRTSPSTRSAPRPTAISLQHVTTAKLKLQGGSPVALNWAIDSVRKGATVSVVGAYGPLFSAVKFGDAMNKGLTLHMNQCPVKRQWPRLFEHVRNGYLKPSELVTHRIPLDDIAEGLPHLLGQARRLHQAARDPERLPEEETMTYTPHKPPIAESADQLRAASRVGGWTATRPTGPSVPKLQFQEDLTGAHWEFPERQPEKWPRERSIEHKFLTPVFGTAQPPKGCPGAIRKFSYARYSEAGPRTGCCSCWPTASTPSEST
jgi:hypothetical protein